MRFSGFIAQSMRRCTSFISADVLTSVRSTRDIVLVSDGLMLRSNASDDTSEQVCARQRAPRARARGGWMRPIVTCGAPAAGPRNDDNDNEASPPGLVVYI